MTLSCRNPLAHPLPVTVKVGLLAYPGSAGHDTQRLTFHAAVQGQSKKQAARVKMPMPPKAAPCRH